MGVEDLLLSKVESDLSSLSATFTAVNTKQAYK
jgi:hypothetical protein